ncbi:MAG: peptidylprolyl isomerase [Rhodobacteraceae bacterium]|nr:peptidylprolyl isomerase [Paracoccaceae bacterium]
MPISFRPVIATVIACGLALPAMAQEQVTADTVLATVGDEEITAGHLFALRTQLPQEYQGLPDAQLYSGLLQQLVQQSALAAQLEEPSTAVERILENERRALFASAVIGEVTETAVTDEALQATYDELYAQAEPSPEYNASHILVESQEAAAEIKTLLDEGGDFAELAQARSTGPSGPNGGELGWFGPGMMVPPFEEAVVALVPGQVSEPVQTQFGWHVIKLNDSRMQDAPALDQVRGELIEKIQTDAVEAQIEAAMAALPVTQKALEEIDPSFLSNPALLDE